jgi:hypothetical protein
MVSSTSIRLTSITTVIYAWKISISSLLHITALYLLSFPYRENNGAIIFLSHISKFIVVPFWRRSIHLNAGVYCSTLQYILYTSIYKFGGPLLWHQFSTPLSFCRSFLAFNHFDTLVARREVEIERGIGPTLIECHFPHNLYQQHSDGALSRSATVEKIYSSTAYLCVVLP